jgi:starch phosphorylase
VHFAGDPRVRSRVVFLEDYDMTIARYLVSGSDVWLNTPRRPLEASGTSGMKAALNGVLNVSIRDGWWDEAYDSRRGWAVGQGEQYDDPKLQDGIEGTALYDLLEREVVPQFYSRGIDGLPREWIRRMKASMRDVGGLFSSHRMLLEYAGRYYLPGLEAHARLAADGYAAAKGLAGYLERVRRGWSGVRVEELSSTSPAILKVGETIAVRARVALDGLAVDEVLVELYHGSLTSQGEIREPRRLEMRPVGTEGAVTLYAADAPADVTGRQGYTLRVLPRHPALAHPFLPGLVKWG